MWIDLSKAARASLCNIPFVKGGQKRFHGNISCLFSIDFSEAHYSFKYRNSISHGRYRRRGYRHNYQIIQRQYHCHECHQTAWNFRDTTRAASAVIITQLSHGSTPAAQRLGHHAAYAPRKRPLSSKKNWRIPNPRFDGEIVIILAEIRKVEK